MVVDGTKFIVAETEQNIVGIGLADGKLMWKTPYAVGMGGGAGGQKGGGKGGKGGGAATTLRLRWRTAKP